MSMLNSRLGSCSRKEGGATLSFCNLLVWRKPKLQWQDVQERLGSVELRITSNAEPQKGAKGRLHHDGRIPKLWQSFVRTIPIV